MTVSTHHAIRLARSAALVTLLALVATPAQAQLGGFIKRKIGEQAAKQVLGPEQSGSPRTGAVDFDDRILEITPARVDQLLRGLAAEEAAPGRYKAAEAEEEKRLVVARREYAARKPEYERKLALVEKQQDAYFKCQAGAIGGAIRRGTGPRVDPEVRKAQQRVLAMPPEQRARFEARQEELVKRHEAAEARGDKAAMKALEDTAAIEAEKFYGVSKEKLERAGAAFDEDLKSSQSKCVEPDSLPPLEEPSSTLPDLETFAREAAVRASGLSEERYTMLRERIAGYVALKFGKGTPAGYLFTHAELAVLDARRERLSPHVDALTGGGATQWSF